MSWRDWERRTNVLDRSCSGDFHRASFPTSEKVSRHAELEGVALRCSFRISLRLLPSPDSGERSPVPLRNVFHDWPGPLRSGHFRYRSAGAAWSLRETLREMRQRGPEARARRSIIRGGGLLHRSVLQCNVDRLCNLCDAKIDRLSNSSGRRPFWGSSWREPPAAQQTPMSSFTRRRRFTSYPVFSLIGLSLKPSAPSLGRVG